MTTSIEEIFTPASIKSLDELFSFLIKEVEARGGDPATIRINTKPIPTNPSIKFSDEWPCWSLQFDFKEEV